MEFLAFNETWAWCAEHGFGLTPTGRLEPPPAEARRARVFYAEGQRSEREPDVAARCVEALGRWDECLLWVTGWGVWASGEDWPRFYAAADAAVVVFPPSRQASGGLVPPEPAVPIFGFATFGFKTAESPRRVL